MGNNSEAVQIDGSIFFDNGDALKFIPATVLYGLQPHGFGTGQVEALDSYLLRLARAHRVPINHLIKQIILPLLEKHGHIWSLSFWNKLPSASYNGVGALPSALCSILEDLTGIHALRFCNLHTLGHVLTQHGLIFNGERYCSLCITDDGKVEQIYGRLLWSVKAVVACPIHRIRLTEHICHANIKEPSGILSNRLPLFGVCAKCGSIAYRCSPPICSTASHAEIWQAAEVEQLISMLPVIGKSVSNELLSKGILEIATALGDGKPTIGAQKAGISKSVLSGWIHRHHIPNFGLLINLCALSQRSIVSVLKGNPVSSNIKEGGLVFKTKKTPRSNFGIPANERKSHLVLALSEKTPQSLSAVARDLGVAPRTLTLKWPELCTKIVRRNQRFQTEQYESDFQKRVEVCRLAIKGLIESNRNVTKRNLASSLNTTLFPCSAWTSACILALEQEGFGELSRNWRS